MHSNSHARHGGTALLSILAALTVSFAARAQETQLPEIVPTLGHSHDITAVAFSPGADRVLSASLDQTIKLWSTSTGDLLRTFQQNSLSINVVSFSPDGRKFVAGGHDQKLRIWDAVTGQLLHTLRGHADDAILKAAHDSDTMLSVDVTFSPDGRLILTGGADKLVKLWNASTGELLRTFSGHLTAVKAVAFSATGDRILSAELGSLKKGALNEVKLWDAKSGKLLKSFDVGLRTVRALRLSPDGDHVIASIGEGIAIWDINSGALASSFGETKKSSLVSGSEFAFAGARVLTPESYPEGSLNRWDAGTGRLLGNLKIAKRLLCFAYSRDGRLILTGGDDRIAKLWDAETGTLLRTFETRVAPARSAAISPDGTLIASGSAETVVKVWSANSGRLLRELGGHIGGVNAVGFSPDGERIVSGGTDKRVRLWDATRGELLQTWEGHASPITSVAFSRDGTRVLSAGGEDDIIMDERFSLKLWDARVGDGGEPLLRTLEGEKNSWPIDALAFSPDGSRALSGGKSQTTKLWDLNAGRLLHIFDDHSGEIMSVAYSPDGTSAASASNGAVTLWSIASGALIRTIKHPDWVYSVAFSPDGRMLASGGDQLIRIWDVRSGRLLRTMKGHSAAVISLSFTRDGMRLLSASKDATLRVWNTASSELMASIVVGRGDEWLAITGGGFFASSPSGGNLLHVVRGYTVTTIEQVRQSLFNPDLVRGALAGDPGGEVKMASRVINLDKVLESGPAPDVEFPSQPRSCAPGTDLKMVSGRIIDRGKGIGRVEWRVNGVTVGVMHPPPGTGATLEVHHELALDPGENVIELVAYNRSNLLASLPAQITLLCPGTGQTVLPELHVLAIGINKYADLGGRAAETAEMTYFAPLEFAVADAKAIAEAMKQAGQGLYGRVIVRTALDEQASKAALDQTISEIAAEVKPRDTFVLFAAAHGYSLPQNGRYFLIPQDYQGGANPAALASAAIGQDQLQDWIGNRVKTKRAIILLDTCRSGALTAGYGRSRIDERPSEAAIGRLHEATGRPVLTAAAAGEDALEVRKLGHGVFTTALVDALRLGDQDGDGLIAVSELVTYVQDHVPKLADGSEVRAVVARRGFGYGEHQSARFGSTGGDFVLARRLP